jgi:hypothetical protein
VLTALAEQRTNGTTEAASQEQGGRR